MRDLEAFTTAGYDKGRPRFVQAAWFVVMNLLFIKWFCPARVRVQLLRAFGATIGENVLIRHRVRVLWPWKLTIGDRSWIGEGAWILDLEPVRIGSDVCVSQEAFLCTGSHDHRRADFRYANAPVTLEDGCWVAARATVLAGVTIGQGAVVGAGVVASRDLLPQTLLTASGTRPIPHAS
ncbi:WcaF family extracellular polysaccharide biosynthesis acetyltransferase [Knoellia sp. LjRoot47]|uniref:WcaF family extracellular polysaccharide biosynthesis acetyltransferase n=1 Tax=Knoellia sp. LjRoot47 TaxID=3342330 RepID=UPI003ECC5742